jgi:hypothetical protein
MLAVALLVLMASMTALVPAGAGAQPHGIAPMAQPSCNFTYLNQDGTAFIGSTAFRVWDGSLDIFIEAFPAASGCQWKPKDVAKADIIIQEYHGHVTHYDPASVALVQKNTGAVVVGNARVASDMLARGVPASKIVELSPALGKNVSAEVLGVNITSYGMIHTASSGATQVDTYLVRMPSGIRWFHGTCAEANSETQYMRGPEFKDLDAMMLDIEHSAATANSNFHPKVLVLDHDYVSGNPDKAQLWDDYPNGKIVMSHNTTYAYVREGPNVLPELSGGTASPLSGTEDAEFTLRVLYRDVDDLRNRGPETVNVNYRNETAGPFKHALTAESTSDPWTTGNWMAWTTKLPPGKYTLRFDATDKRGGYNLTDWLPITINVTPRNKVPQLQSPGLYPQSGDTTTTFRFDIMYRDLDNDPPTLAQVFIDGTAHDLTTDQTAGPWNDWVVYRLSTALPVGDAHRHYFLFFDGIDQSRHPLASASPNWLRGPDVVAPNYPPTLTSAMSSPGEGNRDTEFTISVIYTDGEGDRATTTTAYIDGVPQLMMPPSGSIDFSAGARYTYKTKLSLGPHTLYFTFSDGKHDVRLPEGTGTIAGPTVVNRPPTAVIKVPKDGTRFTPDEWVYLDSEGSADPDRDPLSHTWTSDVDGTLGTEATVERRLSAGSHNITLTVDDGLGGTRTAVVQLLVKAYLPRAYVKEVRMSPTASLVATDPVRITVALGNDGEASADAVDVRILVDGTEVFTDTVTVDIGQTKEVSYTWASTAGDHTVRAEVAGASKEAALQVAANTPPAISPFVFLAGGAPAKFRPGEEVPFRANATDANGDAVTYEWDFGDGTAKSIVRDPSHAYVAAGTYTVTLKVTDKRGGTSERTLQVVVEKPKAKGSPGLEAPLAASALLACVLALAASRRRRGGR